MRKDKRNEQIYLAGDMLYKGSQLLRNAEKEDLVSIGRKVYSPQEDKEINDKKNQTESSNNKLAEKIVCKDTKAIIESDIIIIEPQRFAEGTLVELGQIKGMKDAYEDMFRYMQKLYSERIINIETFAEFVDTYGPKYDKKVYPHLEDLRRTDIPEVGDRRSFGINQYVYGVCLDLTDGIGFYSWEDILKELEVKNNEL